MTMPRVEVITSIERRRRWPREEKERLVAASLEPGVSVSEVARSAGIHVSQLFRWRRELCDRVDAGSLQLVPVEIVPAVAPPAVEVPTPSAPPGRRRRKSGIIEIELGSGRRVRVDPELYHVEDDIRGQPADARLAVRQERSRPILAELEPWLREKLGLISQKTKLAEAIRYTLSRWEGLARFLDDGRIEIDSNTVERSIRPIALNRKNALFAGSDGGAEHWAVIASLIETCKLNDVEPLGYLADVLTRIVNGHPNSQIDELLPWAYIAAPELKAVA